MKPGIVPHQTLPARLGVKASDSVSGVHPAVQWLIELSLFLGLSTQFLLAWTATRFLGQSRDLASSASPVSVVLRASSYLAIGVALLLLIVSVKSVKKESAAIALLLISLLLSTTHLNFAYTSNFTVSYLLIVVASVLGRISPRPEFIRLIACVFVSWNIVGIALRPKWAFVAAYMVNDPGSSALLPFDPVRLSGVTAHPTILGDYAATLALLIFMTRKSRADTALLVALVSLLLLSQTKTAVFIVPVVVLAHTLRLRPKSWLPLLLSFAAFGYTALILEFHDLLPNLTGRTAFWVGLANGVSEHPIFGGGEESIFRVTYAVLHNGIAANAHSAPWQALASGGLVGLSLYIILLVVVWNRARSNRVVLCILLYKALSCLTNGLLPTTEAWIFCLPFLYLDARETEYQFSWTHLFRGHLGNSLSDKTATSG